MLPILCYAWQIWQLRSWGMHWNRLAAGIEVFLVSAIWNHHLIIVHIFLPKWTLPIRGRHMPQILKLKAFILLKTRVHFITIKYLQKWLRLFIRALHFPFLSYKTAVWRGLVCWPVLILLNLNQCVWIQRLCKKVIFWILSGQVVVLSRQVENILVQQNIALTFYIFIFYVW